MSAFRRVLLDVLYAAEKRQAGALCPEACDAARETIIECDLALARERAQTFDER